MPDFLADADKVHELYERVVEVLEKGKCLEDMSLELNIALPQLVDRLIYFVGRYGLASSKLYWAVSPKAREALEEIRKRWPIVHLHPLNLEVLLSELDVDGTTKEEVVLADASERLLSVNTYGTIACCEAALAVIIRSELSSGFGPKWWQKGVPLEVRKVVAAMVEEDPEPAEDKTKYLTMSQLISILDHEWAIFSKVLPKSMTASKKGFLSSLRKMNTLRNRIMHPVRAYTITRQDSELLEEVWKLLIYDYLHSTPVGRLPNKFMINLNTGELAPYPLRGDPQ